MDNNFHYLSARMSDGRFITDYSPNCELNGKLQGDMTSWQYRMFLTKNSDNILNNINMQNKKLFGCNECEGNVPILPKYEQNCSKNGYCVVNEINKNGIGLN